MTKSRLVRGTLDTIGGSSIGALVWWNLMAQVCQNGCALDMGQTLALLATGPLAVIGGAIFGLMLTSALRLIEDH